MKKYVRASVRHYLATALLYNVLIMCVLLVLLNVWTVRGFGDVDRSAWRTVASEFDASRGILTDNVVAILVVAATAVALKRYPRLQLREISLAVFCLQELVNFVCDNALKTAHLRRSFGTEVFELEDVPSEDGVLCRLQLVTDASVASCSYRRFLSPRDVLHVRYDGSDAVHRASVAGEGDTTEALRIVLESGEAIDFAKRPVLVVTPTTSVFESSWNALGYFRSIVGMKSAIVSVLTIFLLDSSEHAISNLVRGYESQFSPSARRFLPLATLFITSILAAIPINLLRFGWAYKQFGEAQKISTSLVCFVFLLLVAVYLRLHSDADEKVFPMRSKTLIALLGLGLLSLFSFIPEIEEACPRFAADWNASAAVTTMTWLSAMMVFTLYGYIISTQLSRVASDM